MDSKLNIIQSEILLELMRKGEARFALLNAKKYPSDQFSYHLRTLVQNKIIDKTDDGVYKLTPKGAKFAAVIEPTTRRPIQQGFVAVRTVLTKDVDGQKQYLVQRRTKSPFKGYLSTPGGKVLLGDSVEGAARTSLTFETGLDAALEIKGMLHIIDELGQDELLDKFFFVVGGTIKGGEFIKDGKTGTNIWMTYGEIAEDPNRHGGLMELIDIIDGKHPWFGEYRY